MAIKQVIEIEVQIDDAVKDVNKLSNSIEDLGDEGKKANKGITDSSKAATRGLKGVATGFKGIGIALKAAGIGLVIGLFIALKDIIGKNQKVMDFFSSVMTTIGLVFNAVTEAVTNAFNSVSKLTGGFDATKAVILNLLNIGLTPLKLAFLALKAGVLGLQLLWEKSFLGKGRPEKIKQLQDSLAEVKQDLIDVGKGVIESGKAIVKNFGEAIDEIGSLTTAVITNVSKVSVKTLKDQADAIVELKNQALLAQAINRGLIEDFDRQAELQRQIRDDVNKSVAERIAANDKLAKVLEEQRIAMLKNADLVIASARNELALNNNIENQVALTDALNEKKAIEAQITGFQSEQLVNKTALMNEELALSNSLIDSEAARKIALDQANVDFIESELDKLEFKKQILESEKELELDRLTAQIKNTEKGTQARLDAEQLLLNKKQEFLLRERKLDILTSKSKVAIANQVANSIINIAGKQSALGKSLAVAQAIWNTKEAVTSALGAKPFGPWNIAQAVATGLFGLKQVKDIIATPNPAGGSSGVSAPSASSITAPAIIAAPSFNVVGTSGTNQLAQSISDQNQVPIEAFVVSTAMTTQQALDRNKQDAASFG